MYQYPIMENSSQYSNGIIRREWVKDPRWSTANFSHFPCSYSLPQDIYPHRCSRPSRRRGVVTPSRHTPDSPQEQSADALPKQRLGGVPQGLGGETEHPGQNMQGPEYPEERRGASPRSAVSRGGGLRIVRAGGQLHRCLCVPTLGWPGVLLTDLPG